MNVYKIGKENVTDKPVVGDLVDLGNLKGLPVVLCQETSVPMLNIDADQIQPGDLKFIKSLGLTISNPDTDKPVALGVDYVDNSWGHKIHQYLTSSSDESSDDSSSDSDDDDSSFFGGGSFLGGMGSSGFGGSSSGGFGGFGGGSFSGGGASAGF